MANEQLDALEQAKKLTQEKISEIEQSLQKLKNEAAQKLQEIDSAIAQARQASQASTIETPKQEVAPVVESPKVEPEPIVETKAAPQPVIEEKQEPLTVASIPAPEPEPIPEPVKEEVKEKEPIIEIEGPVKEVKKGTAKPLSKKDEKEKAKKEEELEQIRKKLKAREAEKQQIATLNKILVQRTKGDSPAEPGNTGIKHTNAEVFIYVIDDNALQLKVMLEKFKNTKSFKKAKGFTSGNECLQYIKKHRYPKNSMIMVVVDYFLEASKNEEDVETGIDVMNKLKDYDSDIEVIVLSGSDDVDIAASAAHFGAISFVKKGDDDFKKIVNNIVWAIHEKTKVRKKADTQRMLKNLAIGIGIAFAIIIGLYYSGILELFRKM